MYTLASIIELSPNCVSSIPWLYPEMAVHEPSETSPLLGKPPEYLGSKFASEETLAHYSTEDGLTPDELPWVTPPELPDEIVHIPEPSQRSPEEERHFNGLPEVRKKLVYIAPAVTIGVSGCLFIKFTVDIAHDHSGVPRCSRRYGGGFELWQDREQSKCTE